LHRAHECLFIKHECACIFQSHRALECLFPAVHMYISIAQST